MTTIQLTFKTPDVIDYAVEDIEEEDEQADVRNACEKWVKYGEYVTIEIDTDKGTATVLEAD